ncbi:MAG: hypothetical protein LQ348_003005 [Seirophora lacunosa]|nr:MAG: hypothetical protein LQ348_003005 [Seirophora lacunosa]
MVGLTVVLVAVTLLQPSQAIVFPRQTPISNSTATSSATPSLITASTPNAPCCFVVQDTIEARYWPYFSTKTWYGLRNITTLVTSITQFVDTTVTNYYTTSTLSNTSYVTSWDLAAPQIPLWNGAAGSQTATEIKINGTATVVGGVTVQSPQAFYVYSTVAVIGVPAVTDTDGNTACATTSTDSVICSYESTQICSGMPSSASLVPSGQESKYCTELTNYTTHLSDNVFPGINTNAEAYFETAQPVTSTYTPAQDASAYDDSITSTVRYTRTATLEYMTISFSTPFVYQPLRGLLQKQNQEVHFLANTDVSGQEPQKRALTPALTLTSNDGAVEDFGYVPQTLIDWMAQNPDYAAQYPGLKDCLPGGPSIMPTDTCGPQQAPGVLDPVPALTVNEAQTVRGEGCFHPGACPTADVTGQASGIQAAPAVAAANNEAQPTQTTAPSSNGVNGIQLGSTPLKPSGNENSDSGTQPSPSQQEPAKENPVPKDQPVQPSSSGLSKSPITVIPLPVDQTTRSVSQPQPQPQDLPNPDNAGTSDNSHSDDQSQDNPNTNNSPIADQDGNQASTEADAPLILSSSHYILDTGATITPGGPALTVSGTTYSVPASPTALIVDNTPQPINPGPMQPDIASAIMAAFGPPSAKGYEKPDPAVKGGLTVLPGGPAVTVSGSVYSVATSGAAVLLNGVTTSLLPDQGLTAVVNPASVIPGGLSLIPGGGPVTVSGTIYSAPTEGAAIIIISSSAIPSLPTIPGTAGPAPGTAQPALVVGSQTLVPESAITVSGTVVSLPGATASAGAGADAGNEVVVVGGITQTFAAAATGTEGEVNISIGAAVVSASFVQPAAATAGNGSAGVAGGSGNNGTGTVAGGNNNSTNGYTGPAFVSGARRRHFEDQVWRGGLMILGILISVGMVL